MENKRLLPEFAVYIFHTGEQIIGDGVNIPFPYFLSDNDVYLYEDYKYTYQKDIDGWHVEPCRKNQSQYGEILNEIASKKTKTMKDSFKDCTLLTVSPDIPDSIVDMSGAFVGCTSLETAKIGNNVVDISHCFENCSSLKEIKKVPHCIKNLDYAFLNCHNLTNINNIGTATDAISMQHTFDGCTAIEHGPNIYNFMYLETIEGAFKNCISMVDIPVLPKNIKIAIGAFENCKSLTVKPDVPLNAKTDETTFLGCENL